MLVCGVGRMPSKTTYKKRKNNNIYVLLHIIILVQIMFSEIIDLIYPPICIACQSRYIPR